MKNYVQNLLLMSCKFIFYGVTLQLLFMSMLMAFDGNAQQNRSVKEVYISLHLDNVSVDEIIDQVEDKTDFKFFFDRKVIDKKTRISLNSSETSVYDVLMLLSRHSGLTFMQVNNTINVKKARNKVITEEPVKIHKQTKTITGKVTSDDAPEGLPGVNVILKGTSTGTVTDIDGKYSIDIPGNDAVLVYSSVGYVQEEIQVSNQSVINVSMVPDIKSLEEIVVVGYGTQRKSDLTAAISSIDGEELSKFPVADAQNAIQGMAPGVEVVRESGAPGGSSRIRIRGIGSISNNSDPIVIIDGVAGDINTVNPSDIKSIEVLKDAAYAAVYGARAANGVILVTTKSGQSGETKVSVNAFAGAQSAYKTPEPLGRDNYAMIVQELHDNVGDDAPAIYQDIIDNPSSYQDVDWMDAIFQSGSMQKYEVSVSGGGDNSNFYFSGGFYDEQGTIIETDHKRYNLRLNSKFDLGKLTIGENLGLVYRKTNGFTDNRPKENMILRESVWMSPTVSPYDASTSHGYGSLPGDFGQDAYNYVAVMELSDNINKDLDITGNIFAEYQILDGLKYRFNAGVDYGNPYELFHMRPYVVDQQWFDTNNYIENQIERSTRVILENIVSYDKTFGDHKISAIAGYTQERFNSELFEADGQGAFTSNDISTFDQLQGDGFDIGSTLTEFNLASYLGRITYGYKGRYHVTALVRRDGSSKFGPNNKWGTFPSISAAWRFSDEPFMDFGWLSNGKLRVSQGTVGRLPDANFAWIATLENRSRTGFGGNAIGAAALREFADEGLKWETEQQTNIGIDLGLLEDRITLSADYYNRKTDEMLLYKPLPIHTGFDDALVNFGSMQNRGYEFNFNYKNSIGDLNYNLSANMTMYNNEVLDIGSEDDAIEGGSPKQHPVGNTTRTVEGEPLASYWGYKAIGIYQAEAEIDTIFAPKASQGDVKFADLNGDGELSDDDKTFLGNPFPDMTYGFNLGLDYKGFDFTANFYGVEGVDVFNANLYNWRAGYRNFNQTTDILNRWTPGSGQNKWPRVAAADPAGNWQEPSDLYIEDASYLRLRLATLGYTLPLELTESIGLSKVRVYVQSQNLFTITDYTGVDPEVAGEEATLGRGVDEGDNYPVPRVFLGGIQIDF